MTDAPPTAESQIPRQPIPYTLGGVTIPMMETPPEAFAKVLEIVQRQLQKQGASVLQVAAAHPFVFEAAAAVVFVAAAESNRALERRVEVLEAMHRAPEVSIEDAVAALRGPALVPVDDASREQDEADPDPSDEADELEARGADPG